MFKALILLFVIIHSHYGYGQENSFSGSIMYSDKKNLAFSLQLYIDSNYQARGSLKRVNQKGEVISNKFKGHFSPENNSIFIQEFKSSVNSCPIIINAFVNNIFDNVFAIVGIFQSSNKEFCDSGHVNIINKNFKFNHYNRSKKNEILNDSMNEKILKNLLQLNVDKEKKFKSITSSDLVKIKLVNDTFVLKINDNLKVDGDRVNITFNDQVISNNLLISEKPHLYFLIAKKGTNKLNIKAINEGSISTNTSKVELYNYKFHEYYENKLYKNQQTTYIIDYE